MSRFFARPDGETAALSKEDSHHFIRVLRARPGDPVEIAWEGKAWEGTLETLEPCVVRIGKEIPSNEPFLDSTLVQALAKGDKMDWIIQKAVELGVSRIIPIRTRYADVKLDGARAEKKQVHWQRISEAAAKQSGRSRIPAVYPVLTLSEAIEEIGPVRLLVLHEKGVEPFLPKKHQPVALFVGPEGGFSDEEISLLQGHKAIICRLGPRILRTETAGLAGLSIVQYEAGDFLHEISN